MEKRCKMKILLTVKTRKCRVNAVPSHLYIEWRANQNILCIMEGVSTNPDECKGVGWILPPTEARGLS